MKLKYWTGFSKRKNSTKIPSATGTEIDVYWKEDTSIDSPSVVLSSNIFNIDYCYINDWGKYYFVSSISTLDDGTVQYDLVEDVLATNKTAIGSTVAHIAYAATGYDAYIVDSRIAVKPTYAYFDNQSAASGLSNQGVYILSVVNGESNGDTGCLTYYYIPYNYLDNLMTDLLDNTVWDNIKAMLDNPMDSVVNLIWVPLPYTALTSGVNIEAASSPIKLMGETLTNTEGFKVIDPVSVLASVSLTIPYRTQDFRDGQPYTDFSLYLPGLGLTDLNSNDFIESLNVSIYTYVDFAHGDITYWIYNDDGVVVKTCMFHCGITVPIAHISTNAGGGIASIGGSVGGFATMIGGLMTGQLGIAAGGAMTGVLSAGNSALQFNKRSTSLQGSDMGRASFHTTTFTLVQSTVDTEDPDDANYISRFGRPVGLTHAISNHSGYVQCENASVSTSGDDWEREQINSFLNGGFYYE